MTPAAQRQARATPRCMLGLQVHVWALWLPLLLQEVLSNAHRNQVRDWVVVLCLQMAQQSGLQQLWARWDHPGQSCMPAGVMALKLQGARRP